MSPEKTGKFIADLRKANNMTQGELAERISVTNKAVSRWETGKGYPDVTSLMALGKFFGVSVNELLNGEKIVEETFSDVAERNMANVLKINEIIKKKTKSIIVVLSVLLVIVLLISLFSSYSSIREQNYTNKIISYNYSKNDITVSDIFNFGFNCAYVIDDPYISGKGLNERYSLNLNIDDVEPGMTEQIRRIIFVDDNGDLVYEFKHNISEFIFSDIGIVIYPSTIISKKETTENETLTLELNSEEYYSNIVYYNNNIYIEEVNEERQIYVRENGFIIKTASFNKNKDCKSIYEMSLIGDLDYTNQSFKHLKATIGSPVAYTADLKPIYVTHNGSVLIFNVVEDVVVSVDKAFE